MEDSESYYTARLLQHLHWHLSQDFPFQYKTQLKTAELTRLIVLHIVFLLTPRLIIQVSVSSHVFTTATLESLSQIGVWSQDKSSSGYIWRIILLKKKSQNHPSVFGLFGHVLKSSLDSIPVYCVASVKLVSLSK